MNRSDVIEECIKCCNLQQLIDDNESDRGYFNAVRDCVNALKALKNAAPPTTATADGPEGAAPRSQGGAAPARETLNVKTV